MFQRISNSWELIKASAAVLRADKELIIFPIVSSVGVLIVTLTFAFPFFLTGLFDAVFFGGAEVLGFVLLFLFYLTQYFIIFFANTALVGTAMIRLRGGDPTVSDGFRIAMKHVGPIFGYALISATVGLLLRWLSERGGAIGRIVVSLIGLAWNVATFLVVPVLVMEEVGPVEAVKRSASLLRKTWGEQIVGNFGIGTVFGLLVVLVILLAVPVVGLAIASGSLALIGLSIATFVLLLIALSLINSALSGIYAAAVYNYAVTGKAGGYFKEDLIQGAFRPK